MDLPHTDNPLVRTPFRFEEKKAFSIVIVA